jgi:hypothetical protein
MTRQWCTGVGWVTTPATRLCKVCGGPVEPHTGKGRPRLYCEAHAPARRATVAAWQRANRDHVRAYQRQRDGSRALEDRTCSCPCRLGLPCARAFRGFVASCPRCRRPTHAARFHEVTR